MKNLLFAASFLTCCSVLASEVVNLDNSFSMPIETAESRRALDACGGELSISVSDTTSPRLLIECGGVKQSYSINGSAPIFDSIKTIDGRLVAEQSVTFMKSFNPSTLRSYYSGILAEYTDTYFYEMGIMAENLKAWDGYI